MAKTTNTHKNSNCANRVLSPVFCKSINATIKNLQEHVDNIKGLGCTFWACEGHTSGKIKSMVGETVTEFPASGFLFNTLITPTF